MADTKITEATTVIPQAGDLLPLGRPGNTNALNTLVSGASLISSVAVSVPVEYVDISLPPEYGSFLLNITGLLGVGNDFLAAAVSFDGGDTFASDQGNADTYTHQYVTGAGSGTYAGNLQDPVFYVAGGTGINASDYPCYILAAIDPGNNDGTFILDANFASAQLDPTRLNVGCQMACLNGGATVPPAFGRINLIRLLPYGNGDVDPPTSGNTITAGTFTLLGIP